MAPCDTDPYLSRREWLGRSGGITLGLAERMAAAAAQRKKIAAIITERGVIDPVNADRIAAVLGPSETR